MSCAETMDYILYAMSIRLCRILFYAQSSAIIVRCGLFKRNMNTDLKIAKDKKGNCHIISHRRCGITECIWLTDDELEELKKLLNERA